MKYYILCFTIFSTVGCAIDAFKTLHNIAGLKIAGFSIRSKLYGEVFTNNQMFQLFNVPPETSMQQDTTTTSIATAHTAQHIRAIFETESNLHNLYMVILALSTISFIIDMNSEYRIEKLKNTKYFNKLEKTIEIFFIVFMTIMMRDVENAI